MGDGMAIQLEGLSKRYGSFTALTDLSFEVAQGEIFGFLGPNGAGKSTTIRSLLGYLRPSSGSARVLGLDSVRDSLAIRRRTGYLPSGPAFDETLSGKSALDQLARLQGGGSARRAELCERLRLPEETLSRRVRDYSRGTRQKLGIVQALQHDPELVILDEPTEGLDPLVQQAFYSIVEEAQRRGTTIFFSSHVLSEVERVCHRVAIVREGRLIAVENVEQLLARRRRHITVRFDGAAPDLSAVPGVTDIHAHEGALSCRLQGEVAPFLSALQGCTVRDLLIEPAHLEDVFLEFYQGDAEPAP
jgi:ABC-2 type transport system ATP-binding protein